MSKSIKSAIAAMLPLAALALPTGAAFAAGGHPQPVVRSEPVQGVYNAPWYNYLADINEAEKELKSDLRHSTDREDTADAWEEYEVELADADKDYTKEMRERGYKVGRVTMLAYRD